MLNGDEGCNLGTCDETTGVFRLHFSFAVYSLHIFHSEFVSLESKMISFFVFKNRHSVNTHVSGIVLPLASLLDGVHGFHDNDIRQLTFTDTNVSSNRIFNDHYSLGEHGSCCSRAAVHNQKQPKSVPW